MAQWLYNPVCQGFEDLLSHLYYQASARVSEDDSIMQMLAAALQTMARTYGPHQLVAMSQYCHLHNYR